MLECSHITDPHLSLFPPTGMCRVDSPRLRDGVRDIPERFRRFWRATKRVCTRRPDLVWTRSARPV